MELHMEPIQMEAETLHPGARSYKYVTNTYLPARDEVFDCDKIMISMPRPYKRPAIY